jgi:hypothetical protein
MALATYATGAACGPLAASARWRHAGAHLHEQVLVPSGHAVLNGDLHKTVGACARAVSADA